MHQAKVKEEIRSVPIAGSRGESSSMNPNQDREGFHWPGGVDIKEEAILGPNHIAGVVAKVVLILHLKKIRRLYILRKRIQLKTNLGANLPRRCTVSNPLPRFSWDGWLPSEISHGGIRIRDSLHREEILASKSFQCSTFHPTLLRLYLLSQANHLRKEDRELKSKKETPGRRKAAAERELLLPLAIFVFLDTCVLYDASFHWISEAV